MNTELTFDGFAAHPNRAMLLLEAHARPFAAYSAETRFLHFAFATNEAEALADRAALARYCIDQGLAGPDDDARHFSARSGASEFRWEQHAEFTTYTWSLPAATCIKATQRWRVCAIQQPGPHLVSIDMSVTAGDSRIETGFDRTSFAMATVRGGGATIATDFKADTEGFVRIAVRDHGMSAVERGALAQRLLELETYRMLALLGLVEARRLAPCIDAIERELAATTAAMTEALCPREEEALLQRLTVLAARLEAAATASLYRFGASRAYAAIVQGRLSAIGEERVAGHATFSEFLGRRLAPAMRTCTTMEERQATLSRKLARAGQLLRTRVDIELAHQNRDLLAAMDQRTSLQVRLQQTIEGLSIAAISYYVIGLMKNVIEAVPLLRSEMGHAVLAAMTPIVIVSVAFFLRHARRKLSAA